MADFILDTDLRIQTRNRKAEPVLAGMSGLERRMAGGALSLANGWDRMGDYMSNGPAAFFAGALFGAVRGGITGYGLAFVIGMTPLAAMATPVLLICLAVGIMRDGARSFNAMRADDPRKRYAQQADWLATRGGALGEARAPALTQTQKWRKAHRDLRAGQRTARDIVRDTDITPPDPLKPAADAPEISTLPGGIVPIEDYRKPVPGGFAEKEQFRRKPRPKLAPDEAGIGNAPSR